MITVTEIAAAAEPLKRLSYMGLAAFEVASQSLPETVTASLKNKEVEGE
ncbi:hypothetical protein [Streptomyces colonosanans]|nr:hypothetical protein [Streptomyces colonosanans]